MMCPECGADMIPGPSIKSVCEACEQNYLKHLDNLRVNVLQAKLNYDKARINEKYLGRDNPDSAYGLRRAEREYDDAYSRYSRALIDRTLRLLPDKDKPA